MKLFKTIILLGFLISSSIHLNGQGALIVEAEILEGNRVSLKWYPTDPTIWLEGLKEGYMVERYEVEGGAPKKVIIANLVLPKEPDWFLYHKDDAEGLMEPVGALLYDTSFQFPSTENLDPVAMRYNYVLAEAERFSEITEAVGLMLMDSTGILGKKYRYVISLNQGSGTKLLGEVEIDNSVIGRFERNPSGRFLEFEFPNDKSLYQMANPKGPEAPPTVFGIAKAYGDSIVLRWAPNKPSLWSESNESGYSIARSKKFGIIGEDIAYLKAWPLDSMEGRIEHDSIAILAAAQIYSREGDEEAQSIMDKSNLFENRWGFALFASERSSLAADILGLRYVDKDVEEGVTYFYSIRSEAAPGFFSSALLTVENNYIPTAPPSGLRIEAKDKVLTIIWDKVENDNRFSAYKLERSEDGGKTWKPVHEDLMVFGEDPKFPLRYYSFMDSVGVNFKPFSYRLKGLDSFGEFSGYAEETGEAIDLTPPYQPLITDVAFYDTLQQGVIKWDPLVIEDDFDYFLVLLGNKPEGTAMDTVSGKLDKNQTEFIYKPEGGISGERAHYFQILASDIYGNVNLSLVQYMHVPDLVPPPPPEVFNGKIADDGTVTLVWEHSKADDVTGYWVYFANDPEQEFGGIHPQPLALNTFTYKIPDVSLNRYIYYKVLAEDRASNRGNPTPALRLERPDKVPPLRPEFYSPFSGPGAITVNWGKSASEDVVKYHVYKRIYGSETDTVWNKIAETIHIDSTAFIDTSVVMDIMYEYRIQAEDGSGNLSEHTLEYSSKIHFNPDAILIKDFKAIPGGDNSSAVLTWNFEPDPRALPPDTSWEFRILKSSGTEEVTFFDSVPSKMMEYTDSKSIEVGTLYNYAIQVRFSDGKRGKMSQVKSVMIE